MLEYAKITEMESKIPSINGLAITATDDNLPLKKTLELFNMIIVVRSVFHEGIAYHPQFFR